MLTDNTRNELLDELISVRCEVYDSGTGSLHKFKDLLQMTDEELIQEYSETVDVNDTLLVACWAQHTRVW